MGNMGFKGHALAVEGRDIMLPAGFDQPCDGSQ